MTPEKIISAFLGHFGTVKATAAHLNVGVSTIRRWKKHPPKKGTVTYMRLQGAYEMFFVEFKRGSA